MACTDSSKQEPLVIKDKEAFVLKLADVYFIDSWVTRAKSTDRDSLKKMLSIDFKDLHGVSLEDFHTELMDLKKDPIIFAEIMDSVHVVLNKKGKGKN